MIYCLLYTFTGAQLAFASVLLGTFFLTPLTLYLTHKRFETLAKCLFIACCHFYIYCARLNFGETSNIDHYFIPAMSIPLILFNFRQQTLIWLSIAWNIIFWSLGEFAGNGFVPAEYLQHNMPLEIFSNINFIGAAACLLVFLLIFKNNVINRSEIKSEFDRLELMAEDIQHIGKIGGWELDVDSNEVIWSHGTYRIHALDPDDRNFKTEKAIDFCVEPPANCQPRAQVYRKGRGLR